MVASVWDFCQCDTSLLAIVIMALVFSELLPVLAAIKGHDDEDHDVSDCEEEDEELRAIDLKDISCWDDLRMRLGRSRGFVHGITQFARSDFVKKATDGIVDITALFQIIRQLFGAERSSKQVKRRRLGKKIQHRHFESAISETSSDSTSSSPPSSLTDENKTDAREKK